MSIWRAPSRADWYGTQYQGLLDPWMPTFRRERRFTTFERSTPAGAFAARAFRPLEASMILPLVKSNGNGSHASKIIRRWQSAAIVPRVQRSKWSRKLWRLPGPIVIRLSLHGAFQHVAPPNWNWESAGSSGTPRRKPLVPVCASM